uniref:Gag polyprotein n=1 Tax=Steinernema glaseri TaxID=37863 RepID=A0A1I8A0V9_9BILA
MVSVNDKINMSLDEIIKMEKRERQKQKKASSSKQGPSKKQHCDQNRTSVRNGKVHKKGDNQPRRQGSQGSKKRFNGKPQNHGKRNFEKKKAQK